VALNIPLFHIWYPSRLGVAKNIFAECVMDSMRDKQVLIIGLIIIYFILTVEKNTEMKGM
jgi:hypothetical protein